MLRQREPLLAFSRLTVRQAIAASRWRYPGAFAMYNLGMIPLAIGALMSAPSLPSSRITCYAIGLPDDPLIGVFSLIWRRDDVEIGIGLRPDLNGHGLGLAAMRQGMAIARMRYAPNTFSLNVASFNRRAVTVYERAGFVPGPTKTIHFHGKPFEEMRMTRSAAE